MPTPGVIKVQIGNKPTAVQSISYGTRTLKSSTDLSLTGAQNGDVIVYNAANNDFSVTSVQTLVPNLDAGFF